MSLYIVMPWYVHIAMSLLIVTSQWKTLQTFWNLSVRRPKPAKPYSGLLNPPIQIQMAYKGQSSFRITAILYRGGSRIFMGGRGGMVQHISAVCKNGEGQKKSKMGVWGWGVAAALDPPQLYTYRACKTLFRPIKATNPSVWMAYKDQSSFRKPLPSNIITDCDVTMGIHSNVIIHCRLFRNSSVRKPKPAKPCSGLYNPLIHQSKWPNKAGPVLL